MKQVRHFDFAGKLNLLAIFWLSLSLSTPVIHGLGYIAPGFIGSTIYTGLAISVLALAHKLPYLALAVFGFLTASAALSFWADPGFLANIYYTFISPQAPDSLLWPLVVMVASSLLFYILLFKLKNPLPPLLIIGLVSFIPLWYLYIDSAYPAAISYILCWLIYLSFKNGNRLWNKTVETKEEQEDMTDLRRSWIQYTISVLAIALFIALVLPKGFSPVQWPALHSWAARVFPFASELRGEEDNDEEEKIRGDGEAFAFYSSGLDETAYLDGPLIQDPTVLLEVKGRGGVYLKGTVYDSYTGKNWVNTSDPAILDYFPAPPAALSDYLLEVELNIRHRRLRTKTLFSVLYPVEIKGLAGPLHLDMNSSITIPHSLSLRQEYDIKGYILAYRADFSALEIEEELTGLEAFRELPADLPPRIEELAREITAGLQGQYEKMKALEQYLRANYSYNTEPPILPGDRDFVDFFLFDTGEGYCTYFASALAVMGRAAGAATRYVVGFKVPERRSEGGIYEVSGTDAHAWVEAYIPGAGWLPFEATPGYSTADSLPPPGDPSGGVVSPPGEYETPPPAPPGHDLPNLDDGIAPPVAPGSDGKRGIQFFGHLLKALPVAALATLVIFSLFMLGRYRLIKRYFGELNRQKPRLRAAGYYNLSLSLLDRLNAGKFPGETPREYSSRIAHEIYRWDLNFGEISEGINRALYSRHDDIPPALAEQAGQFFSFIFDRYIWRVGKMTAFIEILLQGKYFGKKGSFQPFLFTPEA